MFLPSEEDQPKLGEWNPADEAEDLDGTDGTT